MKLNEDVLLKIYNEFLNSDIETKINLRHACPFIYRNYRDTRFIDINNNILILYFKYLLSKPKYVSTNNNLSQNSFENYQKTFESFQKLRLRDITSSCISHFFDIILNEFKTNPNLLYELKDYYQNLRKDVTDIDIKNSNYYNYWYSNSIKNKKEDSLYNEISSTNYYQYNDKNTKESRKNTEQIKELRCRIPCRLLYNNNVSQNEIIQKIMNFAVEQGFQQNIEISYNNFTFQQRIALEGIFEAFYNILQEKFCHYLNIIPNFMQLHSFELHNCQFNYCLYIPLSPNLTTIKVIDSRVKLIIDGNKCPRLKNLTVDEEASIKLIGRNVNDFNQLERLQLRNINFFETKELPIFNHLKSLRLNNYPTNDIVIPSINDLQELFIQDNQLCHNVCIKPQPNLKFLRIWNYHSGLSLMNEDINYIYSTYSTYDSVKDLEDHHFSRVSSHSNCSIFSNNSNSSLTSTILSLFSETNSVIDSPAYFPKVEYLRLGYCSDLHFIKQISQRISTINIKKPSLIDNSRTGFGDLPEKKRLRRFNLIFPNLKTLVIERSYNFINYLKWFIPTLSNLTTLIFKDCYLESNISIDLENITDNLSDDLSALSQNDDDDIIRVKKESEEEEEEALLHCNNLQMVLQKTKFPYNLTEIIFINCSENLPKFIESILKSRHLNIKFTNIQCNNYQLKKWWNMF